MKSWIFPAVAIAISTIALTGCSSAITTTSQEQATTDDSAIYEPTARAQSKCDSSYLYTCDADGNPMLCDKEGNCRSNPAYDAYRYRDFAYGQLPSYNGANTNREFQPFPGVPVMNLSF
jgi:hypothetical protein